MTKIILIFFHILVNFSFCFKNLLYNQSLNIVAKRCPNRCRSSQKLYESKNIDLANDIKENDFIPNVKVMIDVKNINNIPETNGENNFKVIDTHELFKNKKILLISLPGAFTPTCTSKMIPQYEYEYEFFIKEKKFDDIYCITNNDIFVLKSWFKNMNIKNIKYISDGNSSFTESMNMLVDKSNFFMGMRPWRFVAIIEHNILVKMFQEKDKQHNIQSDPYEISSVDNVKQFLMNNEH
ncbi:1-cys peroxiredoxin, putative [Plasmodium gallinaceum]|uniref:1-cys peroxiredoxin, putative n=1 Tax=Plasmodium gallinaceum TaxID=5849 RepID=A0A1J1GLQ2_PLAGA|nr:1-cys peroxiredoxin, putative [Plasmodium gallinaceum]CRG93251.1 1-cys peroxiredoxin, putative [Plasmodium gallinaceum]